MICFTWASDRSATVAAEGQRASAPRSSWPPPVPRAAGPPTIPSAHRWSTAAPAPGALSASKLPVCATRTPRTLRGRSRRRRRRGAPAPVRSARNWAAYRTLRKHDIVVGQLLRSEK